MAAPLRAVWSSYGITAARQQPPQGPTHTLSAETRGCLMSEAIRLRLGICRWIGTTSSCCIDTRHTYDALAAFVCVLCKGDLMLTC